MPTIRSEHDPEPGDVADIDEGSVVVYVFSLSVLRVERIGKRASNDSRNHNVRSGTSQRKKPRVPRYPDLGDAAW